MSSITDVMRGNYSPPSRRSLPEASGKPSITDVMRGNYDLWEDYTGTYGVTDSGGFTIGKAIKSSIGNHIKDSTQLNKYFRSASKLFNDAYDYWGNTTKPLQKAEELEKIYNHAMTLEDEYASSGDRPSVVYSTKKSSTARTEYLEKNGFNSISELEEAISAAHKANGEYDSNYGSAYVDKLQQAYKEGERALKYLEAHKAEIKNYDELYKQTEDFLEGIDQLKGSMLGVRDYYNQWESSDEYYNGLGLRRTIGQSMKATWNTLRGDYISAAATMQAQNADLTLGQSAGAGASGQSYEEAYKEKNAARKEQAIKTAEKAQGYYDLAATSEMLAKWKKNDFSQLLISAGIQLPMVAADAALSAAGTFVGLPGLGLVPMGIRAYGSGAHQAREAGLDWQQQELAGFKSAAVEIATEKMFSAVGKLAYGKGFADDVVGKAIDGMTSNKYVKTALHTAAAFGEEGVEEIMADVLNPAMDFILSLRDEEGNLLDDITLSQVLEDFMVGGIMGLAGTGGQAIISRTNQAFRLNPKLKKMYGENTEALIAEAMETDVGTEARRLAIKYQKKLESGKELSGAEINKLIKETESAFVVEDKGKISAATEKRLAQLGETADIKTLAAAIAKNAVGDPLTFKEQSAIKNSKYGTRVVNELSPEGINSGEFYSEWAQKIGTNKVNADEYSRLVEEASEEIEEETADEAVTDEAEDEPILEPMDYQEQEDYIRDRYTDAIKSGILTEANIQSMVKELRSGTPMVDMIRRADQFVKANKKEKENEERNNADDGSMGRNAGESAGEQSGRVRSGAGESEGKRWKDDPGKQSHGRKNEAVSKNRQVSSRELGIASGTDNKTLRTVPKDKLSAATQRIIDKIGKQASITCVTGRIEVIDSSKTLRYVTGVKSGRSIVFRTDHALYRQEQLLLHEMGHLYLEGQDAVKDELRRRISEALTERELDKLCAKYAVAYEGLYEVPENIDDFEAQQEFLRLFEEEVFCDAFAGINRPGEASGATRITSLVRSFFAEELGIDVDALLAGEEGAKTETKGKAEAEGEKERPRNNSPPEDRFSYGGEEAETADIKTLAEAKALEIHGVDSESIRQQTGWFRGMDGKWRFEIDDSGMELLEKPKLEVHYDTEGESYQTALLENVMEHAALFDAYPELRKYTVVIQETNPGTEGAFFGREKQIILSRDLFKRYTKEYKDYLNGDRKAEINKIESTPEYKEYSRFYDDEELQEQLDPKDWLQQEEAARKRFFSSELGKRYYALKWGKVDIKKFEPGWSPQAKTVLLHELQHAVQKIEGFASGASTRNHDYNKVAGEIEARDTEARSSFTAEQRKNTRPDIDRTDVVFADSNASYSVVDAEEISADILLKESEEEKAKRLSSATITVADAKADNTKAFDYSKLLSIGTTDAKKYLIPIFRKIGIFRKYSNDSLKVEFEYSANGARRSTSHQGEQTPADFREFAIVHANLEAVCQNAYPLEMHYDEKPKGEKSRVEGIATFGSVLRTKSGDIPIKLTVKFYDYSAPKLHVIINNKNKNIFVKEARSQFPESEATENVPVKVRVADFLDFVNNDKEFTKRIPLELITATGNTDTFDRDNSDIRYSPDDALTQEEVQRRKTVKTRANSMGMKKLRERISTIDAQIAGYERTKNRTVAMERELEQLRVERSIYQEALENKEKNAEQAKEDRKKAREAAQEAADKLSVKQTTSQSRKELKKQIFDIYGIKHGLNEIGDSIDAFTEAWIKNGKIGYKAIEKLENVLMDQGEFVAESIDEQAREVRRTVSGGHISVPRSVVNEFGDDWEAFRRRAFGNGIYLSIDSAHADIETWTRDLATLFGKGRFSDEPDEKAQLEKIVDIAEDGKAEKLTVWQMAERIGKTEGDTMADAYIEDVHERLMRALKGFAQSAKIEMETAKRSVYREAKRNAELRDRAERAQAERDMRELQNKTLKQLQWLKSNQNFMANDLQDEAKKILADIDTIAVSAANAMNWSNKYNATWEDIAKMYHWAAENDPNFLPTKELKRIVERIEGTHLDTMSAIELEDLYRAAVALRTTYYNRKNIVGDMEHRQFEEVFDEAMADLRAAKKPKNATGDVQGYFDSMLNPVNRAERMFGWKESSPGFQIFGRALEYGERLTKRYVEQSYQILDKWLEANKDWVKAADGQGKDATWYEIEVPELMEYRMGDKPIFGDTVKVYMTPMQKIHLYLESKNNDNLRHMVGGRTFPDKKLYSKGKYKDAFNKGKTISLAPETVKNLVSDLTPKEQELADLLNTYYNVFSKGEINRVSNILYGYDKAMTSNYAPIYTNDNYNKTEVGVSVDAKAENVKNLKTRIEGASNPSYNISALEAFRKSVALTSRFVGMAIPTHNAETLLNWRANGTTMKKEIAQAWSEAEKDALERTLDELNAPTYQQKSKLEGWFEKRTSDYIGSVFGANLIVCLKVLASLPTAAAVLGNSNFPSFSQRRNVDLEHIRKYTSELDVRIRGLGSPEMAALVLDEGRWQKFVQSHKVTKLLLGGGLLQAVDVYNAKIMWPWTENYVAKSFPHLEPGTEEFDKKVKEVYEDAIAHTQSMYDIMHRSEIMRSSNEIIKSFTIFHTDSLQAQNLLRKRAGELQAAKAEGNESLIKERENALASAVANTILMNTIITLFDILRDLFRRRDDKYRNDDGELTFWSVTSESLMWLAENCSGMLTGVDAVAPALASAFTGDSYFEHQIIAVDIFNSILSIPKKVVPVAKDFFSGFADVIENGGDVWQYLTEAADFRGMIKDTAEDILQFFVGVPIKNVEKLIVNTLGWIWPEMAAAYDGIWEEGKKADLKNSKTLAGDIKVLYSGRGDITGAAADEIARLYKAGYTDAVISDTPNKYTVDGEEITLNEAQKQKYNSVIAYNLDGVLDGLMSSPEYEAAGDAQKAKMLSKLYDYANAMARAEIDPEYDTPNWTEDIPNLLDAGLEWGQITEAIVKQSELNATDMKAGDKATAFAVWVDNKDYTARQATAIKDSVKFFGMVPASASKYEALRSAGLSTDKAEEVNDVLNELTPQKGKTEVSALQKVSAVAYMTIPESDKEKAMKVIYSNSEKAYNRYIIARKHGVLTADYSDYLEMLDKIDADGGNPSQEQFVEAVARSGLNTEAAKEIWYSYGWKSSSPWG